MKAGQVRDAEQAGPSEPPLRAEAVPSDGQLLQRYVKDRDELAFAGLVERYGTLVLGVCERILQDRHYAEDAFQATFLVLVRRAATLDGERSIGNWLYAVAYRTALKARSMVAKRRARERQALEMAVQEPPAESDIRELRPILDEVLNELPEKYRAPLVLCCLQGKTHQEAAKELGWPSGSMSRRMDRARKLLRKRLARRGIILSTGALLVAHLQTASATTVSASLLAGTVKAAMAFGAGAVATAGALSTDVTALAEAVLKQSSAHKWKIGTALAAAAGILVVVALGTSIFYSDEIVSFQARQPVYIPERTTAPSRPGWHLTGTIDSDLGEVIAVALAPNGNTLASASREENWIRIWDLATGNEQTRLRGHTASVHALAYSPNGKLLLSASEDSTLKLWNVLSGREVATLRGHSAGVLSAVFSPDGTMLASAGLDETVRVWDVAAHKSRLTLTGHSGPIFAVAFSPDGRLLASAGKDGTPRVWDVASGGQLLALDGHSGQVTCLAFSLDGKTLASGGTDRTIRLWQIPAGRMQTFFQNHSNQLCSIAFTPGGKLLISSAKDRTVKAWQVQAEREVATLQCYSGTVNSLLLARNGTMMVTGSSDQTIRIWQMDDWLQELE